MTSEEYAMKVGMALNELLNEDSDFYVDIEELEENDNLTNFIHAVSNIAPTMFYNTMTGSNSNYLEHNQIANRLCFQYMKKSSK